MAHIRLFCRTGEGGPGMPPGENHVHVEEDLTSETDGIRLVFNTEYAYVPGSLFVHYGGQTLSKDNDFIESGSREFTLITGLSCNEPFPPTPDIPFIVEYRRPT